MHNNDSNNSNNKNNPLKKCWKAMSTGWVIEYPNSRDGPKDFFDRRSENVMEGERKPKYGDWRKFEGEEGEGEGLGNEDAIFRWSEQVC